VKETALTTENFGCACKHKVVEEYVCKVCDKLNSGGSQYE